MFSTKKIFQYALLCSVFFYSSLAQAANFGPGGTTLTTAYTNASGSTINSQGFLTLSGSSAVFTNAANATFNNATPTPGYLTTLQSGATFNNSGTAKFADLSLAVSGKYNTLAGGTTTGVKLSTNSANFTNSGTTTFGTLVATGGNGPDTISNLAGNFTITGTSLFSNSVFANIANSVTGVATFGGDVSITNSAKFNNGSSLNSYGSNLIAGNVIMNSAGKLTNTNGNMTLGSLNITGTAQALNDTKGILTVNGATYLSNLSTLLTNSGEANFKNTLTVTGGATIVNNLGATLRTTGLTSVSNGGGVTNWGKVITDGLSITGAGASSSYTNSAGAITDASGGISTIGTGARTSSYNNFGTTTFGGLNIATLGTLGNKNNGTLIAGATTVTGTSSLLSNAGTATLASLAASTGGKITNTNALTVTGATSLSSSTLTNSGTAKFQDGMIMANASSLTNTNNLTVTGASVIDNSTYSNTSGSSTFGDLTIQNAANMTNNTGATLTAGATSLSGATLTNSGTANFGTANLSNNSIINNYANAKFGTMDLTDSTFNSYANSELTSADLSLNSSFFNMTSSKLNSSGAITIDSGSLFTVDSGLGYAATSSISTANGLDIFGTLEGSAKITGNVTVEDRGMVKLLATDILNVDGDIRFKEGSIYHTTIDVRDAHDITDTVSLINSDGAIFEGDATISIGSNKRPNELTKKYAILVANDAIVTSPEIDLRTSLLLNYNALWEKTGANQYTLYVKIDTNSIKNISGMTYNEKQLAHAFGDLTFREDLPSELEDTLNYVYTQIATEERLGRLLREYSLETSANYLNYMPTLNRMMTGGADMRMADLHSSNSNNDRNNNLWVTPFSSKSKQDHSKDAINQDIQGFDADVWGLTAGIDKQFSQGLLGAMISYGNINFNGNYTNDKIDSNGVLVGLYGSTQLGKWFADSKLSYTHLWNETKTTYNIPTTRTTKADYGIDVYAFDVKGGYVFNMGNFNLSPSVGIDIAHARQEAFTEEGAGSLSRDIKNANLTSVELPVRLQLDWMNKFDNGNIFKPKLYVEYAREVGDNMVELESNFIGSNGNLIKYNSMYNDRDRYTVGTDIILEMTPDIELGLKYNADFRENYTNNTFMLSGEYKF